MLDELNEILHRKYPYAHVIINKNLSIGDCISLSIIGVPTNNREEFNEFYWDELRGIILAYKPGLVDVDYRYSWEEASYRFGECASFKEWYKNSSLKGGIDLGIFFVGLGLMAAPVILMVVWCTAAIEKYLV